MYGFLYISITPIQELYTKLNQIIEDCLRSLNILIVR